MLKSKSIRLALLVASGLGTTISSHAATAPELSCEAKNAMPWEKFMMHVSYWHEGDQHLSFKFEHQGEHTRVSVSRKQQRIDSVLTERILSAKQAKAWAMTHYIEPGATRIYPVFFIEPTYAPNALDCSEPVTNANLYQSQLTPVDASLVPQPWLINVRYQVSTNLTRNTYVQLKDSSHGEPLELIVVREGNDLEPETFELVLQKQSTDFGTHTFRDINDVSALAGISADGEVIAVNALRHLHLDVMYGTLETLVLRGDSLYRLPLQKTINTYGALSGAVLSKDGNRVVIAHGLSIQLYDYQSQSDRYVLVGKHSLANLLPHDFYREGSLRISEDGLQAFFQTQQDQSYRVVFDLKSEPLPEPEPQPIPEPLPEPEPQPIPEPLPEPEPKPIPEPLPEPEPQPIPEPLPEPEPQPMPEPVLEPEPQPMPEPEPQPVPEPLPEPEPLAAPKA
jgi:hypothetical protein